MQVGTIKEVVWYYTIFRVAVWLLRTVRKASGPIGLIKIAVKVCACVLGTLSTKACAHRQHGCQALTEYLCAVDHRPDPRTTGRFKHCRIGGETLMLASSLIHTALSEVISKE